MEKKTYIPPQLTIVQFRNERGYCESMLFTSSVLLHYMSGIPSQYRETESFSTHSDWKETDGTFWN